MTEMCHCGEPVMFGFDGDPAHTRGMCEFCDSVRCDAYPGSCWPYGERASRGASAYVAYEYNEPAPIYERLMDEHFPVRIEFEIDERYARALRASAWLKGVPLDFLVQDIVLEEIRRPPELEE